MRHRWPVLATGFLALASALALRVADPAPVQALRLRAFDLYQQVAPRPVPPGLPVRVVEIDEAALDVLGQWPWPRTVIASLVERLTALDAAAIGFDIVFAEPDRTSPRQVVELWSGRPEGVALADLLLKLPDHDRVLADSVAASRVVGAVALLRDDSGEIEPPPVKAGFAYGGSDPRSFIGGYRSAVRNLPVLEKTMAGFGSITVVPDRDGLVRRIPLIEALGERILPSLPVETLRVAQGATTIIARTSDASGERAFGASEGLTSLRIGDFVVPVSRNGEFWLWYSESRPQRGLSAARLLAPDWRDLRDRFEGQVVLLGASAQGLRDQRATPLSGSTSSVEIHAEALEQMIAGQFLLRPDWAEGAELLVLVITGLLFILLLPALGPIPSAGLGAVIAFATAAGSWIAFRRFGLLFDPVYPMAAAGLVYVLVTTVRFVISDRERSQVRTAFSRYLAPALVERLAERPDTLKLGGESRELTILFSDIRGFTSLSEGLTPERLTASLNRFLTPMTEALLAEGATIDKYIGDAIMAFWNAPLDQPDHPRRAVRAALAMRRRLRDLTPEWAAEDRAAGEEPVAIRFGLGLNSGACVVGNLGSGQRFDYSAIGDPVNLTARLEGLSKLYDLDIVVGESTARQVPDFALLEIDRVRVVGRAHAVAVFALLGDETVAEDPAFRDLKQLHDAALAAYRRGDWDTAEAGLRALAKGADPLVRPVYPVLLARLDRFRSAPPPDGWDGVYDAEQK